jgi:RNA polymerase sigma factor (sigma-70 family)
LHEAQRPICFHATRLARLVQGAWACWTVEDLRQEGAIAALAAWRTFDPSRGVPFRAYADARIRGAMWDFIRLNRPGKRPGLSVTFVPLPTYPQDLEAFHDPREAGYAQVEARETLRALWHVPYCAGTIGLLLRHIGWEEALRPMARELGMNPSALSNRLGRCRKRLQAALQEDPDHA